MQFLFAIFAWYPGELLDAYNVVLVLSTSRDDVSGAGASQLTS